EPLGNSPPIHRFDRLSDAEHLPALLHHPHGASGLDGERGNIDALVVDLEMAMPNELPRLRARIREAHAEDDVVQSQLQLLKQILSRLSFGGGGSMVVAAELALEQAIHSLYLLLLAQLHSVTRELHPSLAMLPRRIRPALDGALVGVAAVTFEVHLQIFTATD